MNRGTTDPQPSTYPLSYRAIDILDVKIDFHISPQTLDQYWSTLVSPPLLWYQLGLRGLFHWRKPPSSQPYKLLALNAVHYSKQHRHTMSEG